MHILKLVHDIFLWSLKVRLVYITLLIRKIFILVCNIVCNFQATDTRKQENKKKKIVCKLSSSQDTIIDEGEDNS